MKTLPREPTEEMVHAICQIGRDLSDKGECQKCKASVDTNYGPGTQACYLFAKDYWYAGYDAAACVPESERIRELEKELESTTRWHSKHKKDHAYWRKEASLLAEELSRLHHRAQAARNILEEAPIGFRLWAALKDAFSKLTEKLK